MAINVVSNAGPLMVFSKLNVLYLLKGLYGRVEFSLSVYRETVRVGISRKNRKREISYLKIYISVAGCMLGHYSRSKKQAIKSSTLTTILNVNRISP